MVAMSLTGHGHFYLCARQSALSDGFKSRAGPIRGPAARQDLKEVGGNALDRRTGSGYEVKLGEKKAKLIPHTEREELSGYA